MTRATYKKKHLTGGLLAAPEGESVLMVGTWQQEGRPGAGAVAELTSDLNVEGRKD